MLGKQRLGGLVTKWRGKELRIGSGFGAEQRQNMWDARDILIGRLVTFKYQPHGMKDVPRLPIFVGLRSLVDTSI
jgi:DNA ligase-1